MIFGKNGSLFIGKTNFVLQEPILLPNGNYLEGESVIGLEGGSSLDSILPKGASFTTGDAKYITTNEESITDGEIPSLEINPPLLRTLNKLQIDVVNTRASQTKIFLLGSNFGFKKFDPIRFTEETSSELPQPFQTARTYYILELNADEMWIKLGDTPDDANAIEVSSLGSGTVWCHNEIYVVTTFTEFTMPPNYSMNFKWDYSGKFKTGISELIPEGERGFWFTFKYLFLCKNASEVAHFVNFVNFAIDSNNEVRLKPNSDSNYIFDVTMISTKVVSDDRASGKYEIELKTSTLQKNIPNDFFSLMIDRGFTYPIPT